MAVRIRACHPWQRGKRIQKAAEFEGRAETEIQKVMSMTVGGTCAKENVVQCRVIHVTANVTQRVIPTTTQKCQTGQTNEVQQQVFLITCDYHKKDKV